MNFVQDSKFWNVVGWISFASAVFTLFIYFFIDDYYTEAPTWLIAAIASWFYKDYLNDHKSPSVENSKSNPDKTLSSNTDS